MQTAITTDDGTDLNLCDDCAAVRAPCDDSPAWLRLPEWSPRSQSQRDYSAEAAGY